MEGNSGVFGVEELAFKSQFFHLLVMCPWEACLIPWPSWASTASSVKWVHQLSHRAIVRTRQASKHNVLRQHFEHAKGRIYEGCLERMQPCHTKNEGIYGWSFSE